MFFINFSWPGTSTIPIFLFSGSSKKENPRSMVIPLFFSSGRVSVSFPVRYFTRVVFPWSICPAVPITISFILSPLLIFFQAFFNHMSSKYYIFFIYCFHIQNEFVFFNSPDYSCITKP